VRRVTLMSKMRSRRFFSSKVRRWSRSISVSLGSLTPAELSSSPGIKVRYRYASGSIQAPRSPNVILSNGVNPRRLVILECDHAVHIVGAVAGRARRAPLVRAVLSEVSWG